MRKGQRSNDTNFFFILWKSAKSSHPTHLSSVPGELQAHILKYVLKQSLDGGGGERMFIAFD